MGLATSVYANREPSLAGVLWRRWIAFSVNLALWAAIIEVLRLVF